MYSSCLSSSVSFRSGGLVPIRASDWCYCGNGGLQRFGLYSSCCAVSCCCCCCCCTVCVGRVNLSYGLRQSSLLQWNGGRRLLLSGIGTGGGSGCYSRICSVDYGYECSDGDRVDKFDYGVRCLDFDARKSRMAKSRIGGLGLVERREWQRYAGGLSEAEDLIDLLTESLAENSVVSIETKVVRPRKKKVVTNENVCDECNNRRKKSNAAGSLEKKSKLDQEDRSRRNEVTRTGYGRRRSEEVLKEGNSRLRKSAGSGTLQKKSKKDESMKIDLVNVAHRRRRSENVVSEKNGRKEGSGCTTYYSLSSSGEMESNEEYETDQELVTGKYMGESVRKHEDLRNQRDEYGLVEKNERRENRRQNIQKQETSASGLHEENIVVWDRKKSEKKLVEAAVDQSQSATETAQKRYTTSEACNSSLNKNETSQKIFESTEENLNLVMNRKEERRRSDRTNLYSDERLTSSRRYQKESKYESTRESDSVTNSKYLQTSDHQENVSTSTNLTQARKEDTEQNVVQTQSQQQTSTAKIHESDNSRISDMHTGKQLTSSVRTSAQERIQENNQRQDNVSTITEAKLRRKSQQVIDVSDIHRSEIQKSSTTNQQSNSRLKIQEESLSSIIDQSPLETGKSRPMIHEDHQRIQSRKGSKDFPVSEVLCSGSATNIDSQTISHQRIHLSDVRVVEETSYKLNQYEENTERINERRQAQQPTFPEEASDDASNLLLQSTVEQVSSKTGDKRRTQSMEIQAEQQLVARGSLSKVQTSSYVSEGASQETLEGRSSSQYLQQGGQYYASELECYGGHYTDGTHAPPLRHISSEDVLGSAERLENSSNILIEEFVEQAKSDLAALELQEEKLNKTKLDEEGSQKKKVVKGSPHLFEGSEGKEPSDENWDVAYSSVEPPPRTKTPDVSRKAGNVTGRRTGRSLWNIIGDVVLLRWGSRGKSPSTPSNSRKRSSSNESVSSDTWFSGHEISPLQESASPSDQVKLERERTKSPTHVSDVVGVTDKRDHAELDSSLSSEVSGSGSAALGASTSLTSEEGNLARIGFGTSFPGMVESTPTFGASVSFPTIRLGRSPAIRSPLQVSSSPSDPVELESEHRKSKRQGSDVVAVTDKREETVLDSSLSSEISGSRSSVLGASLTMGEGSLAQIGLGTSVPSTIDSTSSLGTSASFPARRLGRSPAVKSTSLGVGEDATTTGSVELIDRQPSSVRLTEASITEEKDGELTERKFQRVKQVTKDRFEEWEEAFMRETEQKKMDEIFMREALEEAQKAAANWEVPVGAVLVQNGKIIARGCNLVEELRDSTAHAEMICIRDASNALRTWRLSETTLYVTLEPCVMCAGAILQARITTLVWGAPNKLLGADGSWIRLLPEIGERDNNPELADKPPAPVHPFHPKMNIRRGVLATDCAQVMQQFFQLRRQKKNKSEPSTPPSCLPVSTNPAKLIKTVHQLFGSTFCL